MLSQIKRRIPKQQPEPSVVEFKCRMCNTPTKRFRNEDEDDEIRRADMYRALSEVLKFTSKEIPHKCPKNTICLSCELSLGQIGQLVQENWNSDHQIMIILKATEDLENPEPQDWITDLKKWVVTAGNVTSSDSDQGGDRSSSSSSTGFKESPLDDDVKIDATTVVDNANPAVGDNPNAFSFESSVLGHDEEGPAAEPSDSEDQHKRTLRRTFRIGGVTFQSVADGRTDKVYFVCTACGTFNAPNSADTSSMETMKLHVRSMHQELAETATSSQ